MFLSMLPSALNEGEQRTSLSGLFPPKNRLPYRLYTYVGRLGRFRKGGGKKKSPTFGTRIQFPCRLARRHFTLFNKSLAKQRRELHYRIHCKRRRNQVCRDNLLRQEHITLLLSMYVTWH